MEGAKSLVPPGVGAEINKGTLDYKLGLSHLRIWLQMREVLTVKMAHNPLCRLSRTRYYLEFHAW